MVGVLAGDCSTIVRDFIGDPSAAGHEDEVCMRTLLAPLPGLVIDYAPAHPRLALWAAFFRRSAADSPCEPTHWSEATTIRTCPSFCREANAARAGCRPSRGRRAPAATL